MTNEERDQLKSHILAQLPADGSAVGNVSLRAELQQEAKRRRIEVNDRDYWDLRNELIHEGHIGVGRGRGGSVYKLTVSSDEQPESTESTKEADLYDPFQGTLDSYWVQEQAIRDYVVQNTASQGRRATGGRWTRPDITLVAVRSYTYIPGKILEVTTFELKPRDNFDVAGVFETAAHSAFSHNSYLAIQVSEDAEQSPDLERIRAECRRLQVGLILFSDPAEWGTWEIAVEPGHRAPDPAAVNEFIATQVDEAKRSRLLEMLK